MEVSAVASFLRDESTVFNELIKKDSLPRTPSSTYRVIQEEMSIFWEVKISVSVRKNSYEPDSNYKCLLV
jgi:hypothetical protein